ncbi:hypothetical protein DICPUDRAFT_157323 [Dictyostelium purpureum]|uniref:Peptidase S54 rhomboid domain-containing protein n=1 Tax=Dictyostelium purpureum TaxID=5786 RepID=F0ZYU5_DICPU|nr:uncharacterized protein DICPUDRAFT_157323 [Dictyostelium purpureum]EGC30889.1 hypothetical protein DICPUDRAFT_157323 [Dictyostelium purpureum]|eukprot:XP_003292594.1 hypothetical protein DICPUDRAFT_157323 [Dictyostelium purpureum]
MNKIKFINNNSYTLKFLINEIKLSNITSNQSNGLFKSKSFQTTNAINTNNIKSFFKRSFNSKHSKNQYNNKFENNNSNNNVNSKLQFEFNDKSWSREQKERYFNSTKTSNIIYVLIGINTAAFLYINSNDDYSFQRQIDRGFLLSLDNFFSQPLTLITSFFAHKSFGHFLFNMVGLYTIGPMVLSTIGASSFFGLYMASGIASGLGFLFLQKYYRDQANGHKFDFFGRNTNQYQYSLQRSNQKALGASGAIYGVMATFACLFPKAILNLYGVIPIPAIVAVGGFFAYDIYHEVYKSRTGICHIGHLAGGVYGLGYYFLRLKGRYTH